MEGEWNKVRGGGAFTRGPELGNLDNSRETGKVKVTPFTGNPRQGKTRRGYKVVKTVLYWWLGLLLSRGE